MDPKDFKQYSNDPRFIPGIYNFCDRWCERCSFQDRCMSYNMDKARGWEPGKTGDTSPQEVWERLKQTFDQTRQIIESLAREHGLEVPAAANDAEQTEQTRVSREGARNHELVTDARAYLKAADAWFRDEKALFSEKGEELMLRESMGMGGTSEEVKALKDAVEVIRWYQPFIYVKLTRAFSSRATESALSEQFPRDSDGTAKTALIAIDRSIEAWTSLRGHFPEKTDGILDVLIQLDRIRKGTEQEFPKARDFVRPGFDERD